MKRIMFLNSVARAQLGIVPNTDADRYAAHWNVATADRSDYTIAAASVIYANLAN